MGERGIDDRVADRIWEKMVAFANYGFPESHSVSFAYLVYASSWIKLHEPAAFCAALLNAQPMGFWSPHTLAQDARRHGVVVHIPDVNVSGATATLEPCPDSHNGVAVRLGLSYVRTVGADLAERIEAARVLEGPYRDMEDLVRRTGAPLDAVEALATAGAFGSLGETRRSALWSAGAVTQSKPDRLAGIVTGADAPALPGLSAREEANADLWATGVSPGGHPTVFVRGELERLGVITAEGLFRTADGSKVTVGGVVTHRQRPMTAGGTTFLSLEDETGLINVVCSKGCWARYRRVARVSPALLVRGRLERTVEDVVNVVAEKLEPLPLGATTRSRDFR
jgi:error-prone DNA polymerase